MWLSVTIQLMPILLAACRPALREVEGGKEVMAELVAHPVVFLLVHDEIIDKDWQVRGMAAYGRCHGREEYKLFPMHDTGSVFKGGQGEDPDWTIPLYHES